MLSRDEILSAIDGIYVARVRGNKDSLTTLWTEDATFHLVGDASLLHPIPVTPQAAQPSIGQMIDTFNFHSVERIDAVVEGNRAAVILRVMASVAGEEPRETQVFDLWELDDDGRARSVVQFTDTAMVAKMLTSVAI